MLTSTLIMTETPKFTSHIQFLAKWFVYEEEALNGWLRLLVAKRTCRPHLSSCSEQLEPWLIHTHTHTSGLMQQLVLTDNWRESVTFTYFLFGRNKIHKWSRHVCILNVTEIDWNKLWQFIRVLQLFLQLPQGLSVHTSNSHLICLILSHPSP